MIMSTTIFYFTGTGNSLMVARDLAHDLEQTRVVSIAQAIRDPEVDLSDDCIGFVFPLYYQGVPAIVQDFVARLPIDASKYVFGIVTNGGGDALNHLSRLLGKKGVRMAAGFQISMPYNYIINNFGLDITTAVKREAQFRLEKVRVKEIAAIVQARKQIGIEKLPALKWRLFASLPVLTYARSASALGKAARHFWVDDHCKGCGSCRSVCPVGNVEIVGGRPVWHDRCQQCLACLHWCPEKAVQYSRYTANKTRYTNPYISLKDMIASTVGEKDEGSRN